MLHPSAQIVKTPQKPLMQPTREHNPMSSFTCGANCSSGHDEDGSAARPEPRTARMYRAFWIETQRFLPNKETPKHVAGCAHAVALTTALPAASASLPAASASLPAASSPVDCGACRTSHSCQSSMPSHNQGPCTRRPHTSPCGGRETPPDSDNRTGRPKCRI